MSDTVKLIYQGDRAVIVPDAGLTVQPGETVSIAAELAASLLVRSDWAKAEKKAPAKERES